MICITHDTGVFNRLDARFFSIGVVFENRIVLVKKKDNFQACLKKSPLNPPKLANNPKPVQKLRASSRVSKPTPILNFSGKIEKKMLSNDSLT